MSRGVLVVSGMELDGKRYNICMIDEAFDRNVQGGTYPLMCTPKDVEFINLSVVPPRDSIRRAGEKLYNALVAHQPVRDFFAQTIPNQVGGVELPVYPLYFRIDTPDAEELPWEILWETQRNFMVLDPQGRWPIARIATSPKRAEPLNRAVGTDLRFAIVLAAAGEKGADEWASISAAFASFNTAADVLGLVSEEESKRVITADAVAWQAGVPTRKVEVDYVGDRDALIERLRGHLPNIVHFFCHGGAEVRPGLEIETRGDRIGKKDYGSILLGSEHLVELAKLPSLWLVVLNCCEGAKTAPALHSLARDLVAAGIPAVVAMRESIAVNDAHLFSEYFYLTLFTQLQGLFTVRNGPTPPDPLPLQEIVWVRAVQEARRRLSSSTGRVPDSSAEWTFPVVYIHRDELNLHPRQLRTTALPQSKRLELLTQLETLRAIRAPLELAADQNAVMQLRNLDAEIQQVVAQLALG
jgi:hypothetical protein